MVLALLCAVAEAKEAGCSYAAGHSEGVPVQEQVQGTLCGEPVPLCVVLAQERESLYAVPALPDGVQVQETRGVPALLGAERVQETHGVPVPLYVVQVLVPLSSLQALPCAVFRYESPLVSEQKAILQRHVRGE